MSSSTPCLVSSDAAKCVKFPMKVRTALRTATFVALGFMSIVNAAATPIDPSGSVNIDLPPPGGVTSNSPNNALLIDSAVTVHGQRVVGSLASTETGPYNLGISTGDLASIVTNGIYQDGSYSTPVSLRVEIDGLFFEYNQLVAQYLQVGQSKFQNFAFSGFMEAGINSVTGQEYNSKTSLFSFQLTQAGTNGGAINYGVNLIVPDNVVVSEPMSMSFLGAGLLALGVFRYKFRKISRVGSMACRARYAGRNGDVTAGLSRT